MSVSFFFTFKKDLIVKEDTGCQFKR
jgi:hypothetical protein